MEDCLRMPDPATTPAIDLFSEPGVSGSAAVTILDNDGDMLRVRTPCASGLVVDETLPSEPGLFDALIRMRVAGGDVGGEGSDDGEVMNVVVTKQKRRLQCK